MKKIILTLTLLFLVSCWMTDQEQIDKIKFCNDAWFGIYKELFWGVSCTTWKLKQDTNVMDCIKEYTNWLDEKYNNPDTVTNLREDNYSNVVKTCNEIFWNKLLTK